MLRRIQSTGPVPVIVLSARSEELTRRHAAALGPQRPQLPALGWADTAPVRPQAPKPDDVP